MVVAVRVGRGVVVALRVGRGRGCSCKGKRGAWL